MLVFYAVQQFPPTCIAIQKLVELLRFSFFNISDNAVSGLLKYRLNLRLGP